MTISPFIHIEPSATSPILIICDHATNIVPEWVSGGSLGISQADMARHIAYDVGALELSRLLAKSLDTHLIASQFSRLVIDPNRGEDDPTLIMKIYDKTIIQANKTLSSEEREQRLSRLYRPYHNAIATTLANMRNGGIEPIIISMHSFTIQLRGRELRPWHVGILSGDDRRLAEPIIAEFERLDGVCVGDNEPYHGALEGDTLDMHGIRDGINHVLIEIRNDLIDTEIGQQKWAAITALVLRKVFEKQGLIL